MHASRLLPPYGFSGYINRICRGEARRGKARPTQRRRRAELLICLEKPQRREGSEGLYYEISSPD